MDPNSVNQQYGTPPNGVPPQPMPPAQNQAYPAPQPNAPQYAPPAPQQQAPAYPYPQPAAPPVAYAPQPQPPVTVGGPSPQTQPAGKSNPNSTQNTLQIAEIRDGIVIMNDGSYRSVVMVKSINFDLMSPQEQEAVEFSYQGFLNALYFPIQIFIRSTRVDLRPYLERLDKIRAEHDNMLLALLMEDYINYMAALSEQTNIMDKHFYVVIPYFPTPDIKKQFAKQSTNFFSGLTSLIKNKEDHVTINEAELATAKDELRNRVQAVLAGLQQCGIQGLPLDTQELIELYYDSYNPDTATRQQLKNFDDLTAPVITKAEGQAPQPQLNREIQ